MTLNDTVALLSSKNASPANATFSRYVPGVWPTAIEQDATPDALVVAVHEPIEPSVNEIALPEIGPSSHDSLAVTVTEVHCFAEVGPV